MRRTPGRATPAANLSSTALDSPAQPEPQVYALRLRAEPDFDAPRAIRALLKITRRRFGPRCLGWVEDLGSDCRVRTSEGTAGPSRHQLARLGGHFKRTRS